MPAWCISASHNPYQDNGIKFFSNDGFKLPDEFEARIEQLILSNEIQHLRPTADAIGKAFRIDDAEGRYIEFVKRSLPKDLDFQGLKLVVDCANGAAYKVAPKVLRELGATVEVIGDKPDGMNINAGCGAVHPDNFKKPSDSTRPMSASLWTAMQTEPSLCASRGRSSMAIMSWPHWPWTCKAKGQLAKHTVVGTVMSNFGLETAMAKAGITCCGHRSAIAISWNACWPTGIILVESNPAISFFWITTRPGTA